MEVYDELEEALKEIERLNNIIKNGINEELRKELDEILKCNQKQANEIERLNNIINELEKKIISICETCYENRETARIEKWINELKGDSSNE